MGSELRRTCGYSLIQPSSILVEPLGSDLLSAHHPPSHYVQDWKPPFISFLPVNIHWCYIVQHADPYTFSSKDLENKIDT